MARRFALLALLVLPVLALYYGGTGAPAYGVRPPEDRFEAGGLLWTARRVAEAFAPLLDAGADLPDACWYEPLPGKGDRMAVLYRFSWPDERHPRPWLHWPYRTWRKAFFGSPRDVEFVWVEVDLDRRKPYRIGFEAPDPGSWLVGHRFTVLDQGKFPVSGTHPVLKLASWNHLFEPGGTPGPQAPLKFLDDAAFSALRMERRSHPPPEFLPDPGRP